MDERTLVYFQDSSVQLLQAYVENGEGFDRAGGFAVQVGVNPTIYVALHLSYTAPLSPRGRAHVCHSAWAGTRQPSHSQD